MGDRRPVRFTAPWTWAGPSLLVRSPRPTENNSSADAAVDASALTAYSGYGDSIRLRSAEKLVVYHADHGGVVIIIHWRDYMDSVAAWNALKRLFTDNPIAS